MWGSDYPHSESTFPQSRKILAEILAPRNREVRPFPDVCLGAQAGGKRAAA
jgi:hypothetical protein